LGNIQDHATAVVDGNDDILQPGTINRLSAF
jgi:hypothetical protein